MQSTGVVTPLNPSRTIRNTELSISVFKYFNKLVSMSTGIGKARVLPNMRIGKARVMPNMHTATGFGSGKAWSMLKAASFGPC